MNYKIPATLLDDEKSANEFINNALVSGELGYKNINAMYDFMKLYYLLQQKVDFYNWMIGKPLYKVVIDEPYFKVVLQQPHYNLKQERNFNNV